MAYVTTYLTRLQSLLSGVTESEIDSVIDLFWDNYQQGRRIVFCGNGGSSSSASHLVADFQKNMYLDGGKPWECLSVVDSVPLLTAWGNDTEYANIFAGQIRTWLRPKDILVAISGSGNSPNILKAVDAADEIGAVTIGFCGFGGGKLSLIVQYPIVIPSYNMQLVEDVHMILGHVVYSAVRDRLLGAEMPQ
jgi:D-sedoheptulose 7-phosphate isomerase